MTPPKTLYVNDNFGSPAAGDTTLGVERLQPLFHLFNGDLCYANLAEDRVRTWWDFWENNSRSARKRPWMPSAGNHENELGNGPIGYQAYQTYFSVPEAEGQTDLTRGLWYAFTVGAVRVVSIANDDVVYQDGGNSYVRGYSEVPRRIGWRRNLPKEFAAQQGVASSTVRNWVQRKQIYAAALLADGKINAVLARRQLAMRRDATRGRPPKSRPPKEDENAEPAPDDLQTIRAQRGGDRVGPRAKPNEPRARHLHADGAGARQSGPRLAQAIAAMDAWVSSVIAELGLSPEASALIRTSFRRWREREADSAEMQAAAVPEFLEGDNSGP